jgi:hypothetical protein
MALLAKRFEVRGTVKLQPATVITAPMAQALRLFHPIRKKSTAEIGRALCYRAPCHSAPTMLQAGFLKLAYRKFAR